jgi:hypothetical protein
MPRISPTQITKAQLDTYASAWAKAEEWSANDLCQCFLSTSGIASNSPLMNFAYMDVATARDLVQNSAGIAVKFVLVNDEAGKPVFTMVLYGVDETPARNAITSFYLLGIATAPANLKIDTENIPIPYPEAKAWIEDWHALTPLPTPPGTFTTASFYTEGQWLMGYLYPKSDFETALSLPEQPNPAFWLNFVLHAPAPGGVFSTILTANSVPPEKEPGTLTLASRVIYLDISKPCPPYC